MTAPVIIPSATLDSTFSGDGKQSTGFGSTNDTARAVATMADGRFVVVGTAGDDFAVARYLANGTLDTSFSGDGKVTTDVSGVGVAQAVAVQADGKVVVVGSANGDLDMVVARYNSDGSLDTSFNGTGLVTTSLDAGTRREGNATVLIQPDGAIVVAGYSHVGDRAAIIQRYTSTGALDTSFSTDGRDQLNFRGLVDRSEIFAMTRQTDGKLLVAGRVDLLNNAGAAYDFAVARYNADGTLDTTFNASGAKPGVLIIDNGSSTERINDIQVQANGKIVLVGNRGSDGFIARLLADGSMDNSFDGNGLATFDNGGNTDEFNSLNIQADGNYLVGGESGSDALVVRFRATDGSLDTSFNSTGMLTTKLVDQNSKILDTALTPDGKFLAVGEGSYDYGNSSWDFAMMQLGVALPEQKIMAYTGTARPADALPDALNYQIPANLFHDADGDALTYSVTLSNGNPLPSWMSFNAATRTLTGTPQGGDFGAYNLKVTASDGNGGSVSANLSVQVRLDLADTVLYAPLDRWGEENPVGTPGVNVTYSFPTAAPNTANANESTYFEAVTGARQQMVRDVLAMYADVAGITFTEVENDSGGSATAEAGTAGAIRVSLYDQWAGSPLGYAYGPGTGKGGDAWLSMPEPNNVQSETSLKVLTMHELGHSVGLKHPFDSGGRFLTDFGYPDHREYAIMSYTRNPEWEIDGVSSSSTTQEYSVKPSTMALADIAALQFMYGVNYNTRSGDTVYTYSNTVPFFKTLWDGGGNDTIDISNFQFSSTVDRKRLGNPY